MDSPQFYLVKFKFVELHSKRNNVKMHQKENSQSFRQCGINRHGA